MQITFTERQSDFLKAVMAGDNVFLTGKAGTGKSFIVKHAMELLKEGGKRVVALAPTGIAANNIDGQTIHSLFALQPFGVLTFDHTNFLSGARKEVIKKANVIFIDEVSMLRPDVLDGINWTMVKNGMKKGLAAKQIVFIGDLKQLEPVLDDNTRSILYQTYDGHAFTDALVYKKIQVRKIELDEILRQTDEEFINALNIVREGGKSEYFRQFLHKEAHGVILAPHNATVREYNEKGLASQSGEVFTFKAQISGTAKPEDFNLEAEIRVKNGCKIMYLINSRDNPLRNGTMGVFVSHAGCHFIRVGNVDYALDPAILTKKQYVYNREKDALELETLGEIIQHPIKLAYALSIHKSQGLTFDEITVDLSRPCFQAGQLYVALSRVRTPAGLRIIVNRY